MPKGRPIRNPNGYGSVVRLSGNRRQPYEVRVNCHMDERHYPVYDVLGRFTDRAIALIELAKYNENPYDIEINSLTFSDVYNDWFKRKYENENKKFSKSTISCTKGAYKKAVKLHDIKFKDIRTLHMQSIIDDRSLSHAYIEHIINLFSQMFKYAMEFDIVKKNYAQFLVITKEEDDEPGLPFTIEEIQLLWNAKHILWVDSVLIYIYSGWRLNELLKMPIEKIDLENKTMTGGLKTASGKNRVVPIHSKIYDMVKKRHEEGNTVLLSLNGGVIYPYAYLPLFKEALLNAGITTKHTPHDCRHTFSTLLDKAGADQNNVKRLLGHSLQDLTQRVYTHKEIEDLRATIELL